MWNTHNGTTHTGNETRTIIQRIHNTSLLKQGSLHSQSSSSNRCWRPVMATVPWFPIQSRSEMTAPLWLVSRLHMLICLDMHYLTGFQSFLARTLGFSPRRSCGNSSTLSHATPMIHVKSPSLHSMCYKNTPSLPSAHAVYQYTLHSIVPIFDFLCLCTGDQSQSRKNLWICAHFLMVAMSIASAAGVTQHMALSITMCTFHGPPHGVLTLK